MIRFRRGAGVLGLMMAGAVAGGCSFTQPTLSKTGDEHRNTVRTVWERDRAGLMDDLDLVFQTDRPSRLTKWHDK